MKYSNKYKTYNEKYDIEIGIVNIHYEYAIMLFDRNLVNEAKYISFIIEKGLKYCILHDKNEVQIDKKLANI